MCPVQNRPQESFNGDSVLLSTITACEQREANAAFNRKIESFETRLFEALALGASSGLLCTSPPAMPPLPIPALTFCTSLATVSPSPPSITPAIFQHVCSQQIPESSLPQPTPATPPKSPPKALPMQGIKIPDLAKGRWMEAVLQWESPNKATLTAMGGICLRDWPREWYTGLNKKIYGAKRGQRELIARGFAE